MDLAIERAIENYRMIASWEEECFRDTGTMGFKLRPYYYGDRLITECLFCKTDKGAVVGIKILGGKNVMFACACKECFDIICRELGEHIIYN